MAMASLKAAFSVRKSLRLGRKSRSKSKVTENENQEENSNSSSGSCDKDKDCSSQNGSILFENPIFSEESDPSPPAASPIALCRTPPKDQSLTLSPNEAWKVCRNLLGSPDSGKRKSDEENDCLSPLKSPRQTPPKSKNCEKITPKSTRAPHPAKRTSISTPRRLFTDSENGCASEPNSPSTPSRSFSNLKLLSPGQGLRLQRPDAKPYQSAKHALHTAKPERLIGRDKEEEELEEFIADKIDNQTSSSIYISGPPGTGKTAVVGHVVDRLQCHYTDVKTSVINCMMLRDSSSVFSHLHQQITGQPLKVKDSVKAMERLVTSSKTSILLVLDEIDQLDSKHHEILYRIFEWPALKGSRVILIGIANALDLTDRMLPRLQAAVKCKPVLMSFAPYTSTQITDILKTRLEKDSIVEPSAISFCARKVASVAGDVRKALDVCRRAVEMVESDVRTQQILKPTDCNSPTKSQRPTVKTVNITHISKVMANIYDSSISTATTAGDDIPLQQKLAVCSLLLLIKSGKVKEVTLGKLYDSYVKVCRRQQTASVDQTEFHSLLSLLESRGVTSLKKAKDTRMIKVSLKLDEQELEQTLKDKRLMAAILKAGIN